MKEGEEKKNKNEGREERMEERRNKEKGKRGNVILPFCCVEGEAPFCILSPGRSAG